MKYIPQNHSFFLHLEYRDDTEWAEDMMETERNFSYLKLMGETTPWFDPLLIFAAPFSITSFFYHAL